MNTMQPLSDLMVELTRLEQDLIQELSSLSDTHVELQAGRLKE